MKSIPSTVCCLWSIFSYWKIAEKKRQKIIMIDFLYLIFLDELFPPLGRSYVLFNQNLRNTFWLLNAIFWKCRETVWKLRWNKGHWYLLLQFRMEFVCCILVKYFLFWRCMWVSFSNTACQKKLIFYSIFPFNFSYAWTLVDLLLTWV